jgi:hypothetical protein
MDKEFSMKNKKTLFALLAVALVLAMTACSNGGGGGSPPPASGPTSTEYRSADADGNIYELEIFKKGTRAAYSPKDGDDCVVTVYFRQGGKKTSTGTIRVSDNGTTFSITKGTVEFTIKTSGGKITKIEGAVILFDDDSTLDIPTGELTQASLFTLTGIPSEYNGKYAMLWGDLEGGTRDNELVGYLDNTGNNRLKLYGIKDGSVNINVRTNTYPYEGYTGSGTAEMTIYIFNYEEAYYTPNDNNTGGTVDTGSSNDLLVIEAVKFTDGTASAKWSDCTVGFPKTLRIVNTPQTVFSGITLPCYVTLLLVPQGTKFDESFDMANLVAGSWWRNFDSTALSYQYYLFDLYVPDASNKRWTGRGVYDVAFIISESELNGTPASIASIKAVYMAESINIDNTYYTTATTEMGWSSFRQIPLP